jgi:hypothetical protein
MSIPVHRTGLSSNASTGPEITKANVYVEYGRMRFSFVEPRGYNTYTGKPGGSHFTLWPDSDSFAAIAKAMMESDREAAIKAFGTALLGEPEVSAEEKAA